LVLYRMPERLNGVAKATEKHANHFG
jgi:hypothetical protein